MKPDPQPFRYDPIAHAIEKFTIRLIMLALLYHLCAMLWNHVILPPFQGSDKKQHQLVQPNANAPWGTGLGDTMTNAPIVQVHWTKVYEMVSNHFAKQGGTPKGFETVQEKFVCCIGMIGDENSLVVGLCARPEQSIEPGDLTSAMAALAELRQWPAASRLKVVFVTVGKFSPAARRIGELLGVKMEDGNILI